MRPTIAVWSGFGPTPPNTTTRGVPLRCIWQGAEGDVSTFPPLTHTLPGFTCSTAVWPHRLEAALMLSGVTRAHSAVSVFSKNESLYSSRPSTLELFSLVLPAAVASSTRNTDSPPYTNKCLFSTVVVCRARGAGAGPVQGKLHQLCHEQQRGVSVCTDGGGWRVECCSGTSLRQGQR